MCKGRFQIKKSKNVMEISMSGLIFFNAFLDDSEAIQKKCNSEMEWPRPPPPLDGKFHHVFTFFNLKPSLIPL